MTPTATRTSEGYLGAWLAPRLLLLAGFDQGNGATPEVSASAAGQEIEAHTEEATVGAGGSRTPGLRALLVRFTEPASAGGWNGDLELRVAGSPVRVPNAPAAGNDTDLSTLLRNRMAGLDSAEREQLIDFIVQGSAPELEGYGGTALAARLRLVRDALRERFPISEVKEGAPRAVAIDDILAIDNWHYWIKGWVWDIDSSSPQIEIVSPEGARVSLLDNAFRWRRRDIEQLYSGLGVKRSLNGFVASVELPAPSRAADGWVARLLLPDGDGLETQGSPVVRPPVVVRDLILRDLDWVDRDKDRLVAEHAFPAISRVLERMADAVEVDQTFQYGTPPQDPQTSIVVSLTGSADAIEHHLIRFRNDPDVQGADLIYLIDMAEGADELASRLAELHWLYPVPFRLVTLTGKAGPAVMDTIGASIARAPRLLFLSPDVMPDRPGWLSEMSSAYASQPNVGALGAVMTYEDGSLQHAGLAFEPISPGELGLPAADSPIWQARSMFKGLPSNFEEAAKLRNVPAVSGACMMVDRELFEEVGGLRNAFVEGEFEDVDFCMRVAAAGRENWCIPIASLFHLEGRTRSLPEPVARYYNALVLTHLWRDRIEATR